MESLADFLGTQRVDLPDAPKAAPPNPKLTGKAFARALLNSEEYRQSLYDRARLSLLPPALEVLLYHYAYGKPTEHLEVKDKTSKLEELSVEQLEERAVRLLERARKLRGDQPSLGVEAVH